MQQDTRLWRAWQEWSSAVIAAPLLQELEMAAAEAHLSLPRFVAEVLECAAASRRLPRVESSTGVIRIPGQSDCAEGFPIETYRVAIDG